MKNKPEIYLASPLGFSESGRNYLYEVLIPAITENGFKTINPWELTSSDLAAAIKGMPPGREKRAKWKELNTLIGSNNTSGIDKADGIIAVLDGTDVDSGTAAEIGYAAALGKPVSGYRSDFRMAGDNEGATVNLQVEFFIYKSGGTISSTIPELIRDLKKIMNMPMHSGEKPPLSGISD